MVTKTVTITEEAYDILAGNKIEDESFSEEITRLLSKRRRKSLEQYFGIFSPQEGTGLLQDLQQIQKMNLRALKEKKL